MDSQKVPTADIGEESLTNFYQLVESGFNDTRVLNFTTCIDLNDDTLTGIQLTLWSEEYQVPLSLDPIGYLESNCRTLTLDGGGIDSVKASFSQEKSQVNAVQFEKGGRTVSYGKLIPESVKVWNFT